MLVVRWEGGMVLVVQVIVGVWAAWVGWGRGGSRAKLGVSESKSEKLIQRSWGFERPHEDQVCRWAKGPAIESLCHVLMD